MSREQPRAEYLRPSSIAELDAAVEQRPEPCTPRELFCCLLLEPEEHAHYLPAAFRFAATALQQAPALEAASATPELFVEALLGYGRDTLAPTPLSDYAPSWPARVVREYGPSGLSNGAWLRGSLSAANGTLELTSPLLRSFCIRAGDAGRREGFAERYHSLLRSLGHPPAAVTRWDWQESSPCIDLSYEHALLGLSVGLFPASFGPEVLGFNLWMAALGPAPLLERLKPELATRGACQRFLQQNERRLLV